MITTTITIEKIDGLESVNFRGGDDAAVCKWYQNKVEEAQEKGLNEGKRSVLDNIIKALEKGALNL